MLIVDSLSHAWAGEGGILDMHDKAAAANRAGNSFAAWREVTPAHNQLVDCLLGADLHLITTLRTKTAYDLVDDGKGKKRPVKIGLAPVQRDGMEYEFTLVLDLSVDSHVATATKDRTRLFDGQHFVPTRETGEALREWLATGQDPAVQSGKLLRRLKGAVRRVEDLSGLNDWWRAHGPEIAQLTRADAERLKEHCAQRKAALLAAAEAAKPGNGQAPAGLDALVTP